MNFMYMFYKHCHAEIHRCTGTHNRDPRFTCKMCWCCCPKAVEKRGKECWWQGLKRICITSRRRQALFCMCAKGESEVESAEQLFAKIRDNFGETSEEERKIEQLRTIEQGGRTCDEYVQEFKKVARGSGYEGRPLIKEFKRGLNGAIRRKLAEAEELPTTIGEWQERAVRLDRNQRQSRVEERVLGRSVVCPGENVQPRGGGPYGGRGGQITWRTGGGYRGGGGGNMPNRGGAQTGPRRDPNAIDVDRGRGGDRTCYVCRK